jgi:hypothetical protein
MPPNRLLRDLQRLRPADHARALAHRDPRPAVHSTGPAALVQLRDVPALPARAVVPSDVRAEHGAAEPSDAVSGGDVGRGFGARGVERGEAAKVPY